MPNRHSDDVPYEPVGAGVGASRQVLIGADEGPHFAMRRFSLAAGGHMPLHTNTVEHEQYVLSGRAAVTIGAETQEVAPGSVVFIPAGVPHDYRVVGDEPFVFLCLVPNEPADVIAMVDGDAPGDDHRGA